MGSCSSCIFSHWHVDSSDHFWFVMVTQEITNSYFELLGIPETELPPNRYRLLGIPPFTTNDVVIRNGADRQMQFLRRVGGDKYMDDVQRILNEVAEAKLFLLNDDKRSAYDEQLRDDLAPEGSAGTIRTTARSANVVTLTILDGEKAGESLAFESDTIRINGSSTANLQIPGLHRSFLIRRCQSQWVIESPLETLALNQKLVEDRAFLNSGDVIRLKPDGNSIQFQVGENYQSQVSYWLEKFPHCRIDLPATETNLQPHWNQESAASRKANEASRPQFVKKTDAGISFAMIAFCILAGCGIGAVIFYFVYSRLL